MQQNPTYSPREPEIRVELVNRIRREIQNGTYETPEKLQFALERLIEDGEAHLERTVHPT